MNELIVKSNFINLTCIRWKESDKILNVDPIKYL